jgi:hypothetical protein
MSRHSVVRSDYIEASLHLVFKANGDVRMTRGQPDLSRDERALALTAKIPSALFRTPTLQAKLTIDAPEMPVPVIDVYAAQEALRGVVGCDVEVVVRDAE